MGARLRAHLSQEEDRTLFELRKGEKVQQQVKDRAEVVRLSNRGWYVEKIAEFFQWNQQTVRETLHRWQQRGLGGLWDAAGRGKQRRWKEENMEYLEKILLSEGRTYNSLQLAQKLEEERGVKLSPGHLRELLKKRGLSGNAPARVIKASKIHFLPKYCSEMNPIESEWHQLKAHEIAGQMFEDELDLAYAIMDGVEARAEAGEYQTQRYKFPSQYCKGEERSGLCSRNYYANTPSD